MGARPLDDANVCLQNIDKNIDSSIFLLVQRWTLIVLLARFDAAVRSPFCLIGKRIIFYFRRLLNSPLLALLCASAFARAAAFARPLAVAAGACAQHVRRRDGDESSVVRLGERHRSLACCPAVVVVASRSGAPSLWLFRAVAWSTRPLDDAFQLLLASTVRRRA